MACGCDPGSTQNGWHETRSDACESEDRRIWAEFMAGLNKTIRLKSFLAGRWTLRLSGGKVLSTNKEEQCE